MLESEHVNRDNISKVFGVLWSHVDDMFYISAPDNMMSSSIVMKREALHHISKIFDPLGLLVPVTFYGRVFIQKLWTLKQSWDQPLPANLV